MRCGINHGPAYVGDAGPEQSREYTAIGDTINVAARLEAVNKQCGTLTLVSESARSRVGSDQYFFRPVGRLKLRNRAGALMTYELVGPVDRATDRQRAEAHLMDAMVGAFHAAAFAACLELLDKLDREHGATKLRDRYRDRCTEFQHAGPPEGFEGEIIDQD
jgi:adenylate cyclase